MKCKKTVQFSAIIETPPLNLPEGRDLRNIVGIDNVGTSRDLSTKKKGQASHLSL